MTAAKCLCGYTCSKSSNMKRHISKCSIAQMSEAEYGIYVEKKKRSPADWTTVQRCDASTRTPPRPSGDASTQTPPLPSGDASAQMPLRPSEAAPMDTLLIEREQTAREHVKLDILNAQIRLLQLQRTVAF